MSGDREAISEQLSVREGVGYDEVFQSSHEPEEGLSRWSKRKTSAHSPDDKVESYDGGEGEEEEGEDDDDEGGKDEEYRGEDDEDEGDKRAPKGESSGSPADGHTRPFILPKMWTINDFKLTMMTNIFKNLQELFKFRTISQSIFPRSLKSATRGGPRTSACMTPYSRQD